MGKDSQIGWLITPQPDGSIIMGHTFNDWIGCTPVSPGCLNCYAREMMEFRYKRAKWKKGEPRVRTGEDNRKQPLRWNRAAAKAGVRAKVFSSSLGDWLDDEVPIEWLADLLASIVATPNLDWLLLSKRVDLWRKRLEAVADWIVNQSATKYWEVTKFVCDWLNAANGIIGGVLGGKIPENVWMGTSVENQPMADLRIPALLAIPAKIRFLSCEPLLGRLELSHWLEAPATMCAVCGWQPGEGMTRYLEIHGYEASCIRCKACLPNHGNRGISWIIAGGESGRGKNIRPMHPYHVRSLRDQCVAAGVAFFMKQWGEWLPGELTPDSGTCYRRCDNGEIYDYRVGDRHERQNFGTDPDPYSGHLITMRIGTRKSGRMLDGVEWSQFPNTDRNSND